MAGPASVTIIRHGEKPAEDPTQPPFGVDPEGLASTHSLTPLGWQRAEALAELLLAAQVRPPFVRPTVLVAPNYDGHETHRRPYQTLMPTGQALPAAIQTPYAEDTEADLATWLAGQDGAHVLLCWEHHRIPAIAGPLAQALGVTTELPSNATDWPDDDFWSALVFTVGEVGYTLTQTSEALLPGDPPA